MIKNMEDIINDLKAKKTIIYGAGKIGHRLTEAFDYYNINIDYFWDRNAETIKKVNGIDVFIPDPKSLQNHDDYIVIITVYDENLCLSIRNYLIKNGISNILYKKEIINSIIYSECYNKKENKLFSFYLHQCHICPVMKDWGDRCDIFTSSVAEKYGGTSIDSSNENNLVIPSMGVIVTNRCTLSCKGCNHLRDLYEPSDNVTFSVDVIIDDLKKIISAVDLIEKLVIVGGEAFVHKDIVEILKRIIELPKIGYIQIITNGTVILKDERIYELLKHPKVLIEVSGYGDRIPERLQKNVNNFIKKLDEFDIVYDYVETLTWFDFGDFEYRNYSPEEHLRVYETCCFISNDLFDGKMYKCSRSVFATHLKKIRDYPSDYVDIRALPADILRKRLKSYLAFGKPMVCQHCNGTASDCIDPGCQL